MAYKVFISHSTWDKGLVISLANLLTKFGIEVSVAEWYLSPGEKLDRKIFYLIGEADSVIALLTKNGIRSNWVQQEIGYALSKNKTIIPLVEKCIDSQNLAALQGLEYIEFDPFQSEASLLGASEYIRKLKLNKEEKEKTLLVAGGIFALLLLLSREKK